MQNKHTTTWETFEPRLEKEEKKQGRKLQSISYSKSWPLCSEMLTMRNKKSKRSFSSGLNAGGKRPRIAASGCAGTCRVYPPRHTHAPVCTDTHANVYTQQWHREAMSVLLLEGQTAVESDDQGFPALTRLPGTEAAFCMGDGCSREEPALGLCTTSVLIWD